MVSININTPICQNPKILLFISNKISLNTNLQEEYYIKSNDNKKMCAIKKMGIPTILFHLSKVTSYYRNVVFWNLLLFKFGKKS